jgi:thiamine pyrophosphokinase
MSSHHIVREKQEPALFIGDFNSFDEEYLGQLLEWSPTVMVAECCYEKIASMGIKIDAVVCQKENSINFQESINFIYKSVNESFLAKALHFFIDEGYPAVNIICDIFEAKNFIDFINQIDIVVFANHKKYYAIKNGFNKWSAKDSVIEVYSEPFQYYGIQKTSANTFITLNDGFYGFTFEQKNLFVAEQL